MNILSFLSAGTAFLFLAVVARRASPHMDLQNIFVLLVCGSLGWWAACDAFFYVASSREDAWLWHNLSAIGWCGFIAVTAYYFLILSGAVKKIPLLMKIVYWAFAAALTLRFSVLCPTAMAKDLVQSSSGLGWTFVPAYDTPWPYIFLAYLLVYLGGALGYTFWWQRRQPEKSKRHLAVGFVIVDTIAVSVGFISLFVLPCFTDFLPPMGFVALMIFLWGYYHELWEYDLSRVELVFNPQEIFDNSLDAMLITDLHSQILYANKAALRLLRMKSLESCRLSDYIQRDDANVFDKFLEDGDEQISGSTLTLSDGVSVIITANRVETRRRQQTLLIFSMHDISQITQTQAQIKHMAYYDDLTGLPNRRRLGESLSNWEKISIDEGCDFIMLFSDLNHFKEINDQFGHNAGDAALVGVADAIRKTMYPGDECFRLSGDEFILLHRMQPGERPENLINRMKKVVRSVDTTSFAPTISLDAAVGICLYSEHHSIQQMLRAADQRMYRAKEEAHAKR